MATLKNLVDETTNIKNELVECYSNLKNSLIAKGVDTGSSDKLSTLVEKIKDVTVTQVTAGDSFTLYEDTEYSFSKITKYNYFPVEYIFMSDGDYRLSVDYRTNGSNYYAYVKLIILDKNDSIVYEKEFSTSRISYLTVTTDVTNVKKGYKFKVMGKTTSLGSTYISNASVLCDLEWK